MKHLLAYSVAMTSLLTTVTIFAGGPDVMLVAEPQYFNGLYVGGTGAGHYTNFQGNSTVEVATTSQNIQAASQNAIAEGLSTGSFNNQLDDTPFDGYAGIQGGIGKVLPLFGQKFYFGLQGFAEWGNQSSTSVNNTNITTTEQSISQFANLESSTESTETTQGSSTTKVSISDNYGTAAKLGILLGPRTLLYGKVGVVWAKMTVSQSEIINEDTSFVSTLNSNGKINVTTIDSSQNATGSSSADSTKFSLLLGMGIEQYIYADRVTINLEYNHANYGYLTTQPGNLIGSISSVSQVFDSGTLVQETSSMDSDVLFGTTQASGRADVNTFLAGLNVYFGSDWI